MRAQRTIDAWNSGKILVPAQAPWASGFLARVLSWRGIDGEPDDEIDALVSAVDGGMWSTGVPLALGTPRGGMSDLRRR